MLKQRITLTLFVGITLFGSAHATTFDEQIQEEQKNITYLNESLASMANAMNKGKLSQKIADSCMKLDTKNVSAIEPSLKSDTKSLEITALPRSSTTPTDAQLSELMNKVTTKIQMLTKKLSNVVMLSSNSLITGYKELARKENETAKPKGGKK